MTGRMLHLAGFFPFGPHYVWADAPRRDIYYDVGAYVDLARSAERGLFSAIFLGDSQRLREHLGGITDTAVTGRPDQLVLFATLAAATERIGLVATLNTTYSDPVDLARRIATIDALSGGRVGWNLVTTDNAWTGENFRRGGYLANADRYRHAAEHLAICRALWDGWPDDALATDQAAPSWSAPGSLPTVRFGGEFYDVAARPSVPTSPQGQPVLFQAGESDEGRDFAARHAEAIFSRYLAFDAALDFATDMSRRLVAAGRPADDLRIFPAARITLGDTVAEATERARWFHDQTWSDRSTIAVIEAVWGCDLSDHDLDGPLPAFEPVLEEQTTTHGVVNSRDRPLRDGRRVAAAGRRAGLDDAAAGAPPDGVDRVHRHAVDGVRQAGALRRRRRAARAQPGAELGPRWLRRRRRPPRAGAAGTWHLPHRVLRHDAARAPRPASTHRPPGARRHRRRRRPGPDRRGGLTMERTTSIATLAFLTPGNYPDDDPAQGLDETLDLFEESERIGFDGGWIRQRHLEHGVSSGAVFLAAAAQRTRTIELGTAVIPIGYENPFRLAEDLATADVLSHGRLQPGFSAGTPPHAELIGHLVHDTDWRRLDLSHHRVERLIEHLRGGYIGDPDTVIHSPGNVQRPRVQPHSPGLAERVWYGAASLPSVRWTGSAGVNLLLGNVTAAEGTTDFATAQVNQIAAFRAALPAGRSPRIAIGRVILPTDSADPRREPATPSTGPAAASAR